MSGKQKAQLAIALSSMAVFALPGQVQAHNSVGTWNSWALFCASLYIVVPLITFILLVGNFTWKNSIVRGICIALMGLTLYGSLAAAKILEQLTLAGMLLLGVEVLLLYKSWKS